MSGTYKLGPWPLGIDNVSKENVLKRDQNGRTIAVRDAFNVDIDRDGLPARRNGYARTFDLPGLHSLWSGSVGAFGVAAAVLYRLTDADATAVCTLNSDDLCDYSELNGNLIVGNRTSLIEVSATSWRTVGVPDAPIPGVSADPAGGLHAGRYSVAIAYMRGDEEGALSPLQTVTVAEGGGLRLTLPAANPEITGVRIYRTELGGEVLYHCADAPPGMPNYLIGGDLRGKDTPTLFLTRMLPGELVTHWRGRLLVARGRTLYWSEPMAYGLTSLRHNFVQLPKRITMMAGMESGVFIGSADGVIFLRGTTPKDWAITFTSGRPPVKRCLVITEGDNIDSNMGQTGKQVAVWLADNGFVLGTEDGSVIPAQANRLRIPLALSGSLAFHARRATAVTT